MPSTVLGSGSLCSNDAKVNIKNRHHKEVTHHIDFVYLLPTRRHRKYENCRLAGRRYIPTKIDFQHIFRTSRIVNSYSNSLVPDLSMTTKFGFCFLDISQLATRNRYRLEHLLLLWKWSTHNIFMCAPKIFFRSSCIFFNCYK